MFNNLKNWLTQKKTKRLLVFSLIFLILGLAVSGALLLAFNTLRDSKDYAAKVNRTEISFEQLDSATTAKITFLTVNNQSYDQDTVRSDTLNNLIDNELINQFGEENSIIVADEEVQSLFNARANQIGSEQELIREISRLYGLDIDSYKRSLRDDLLREKVQASISPQPLVEWLAQQRTEQKVVINL